MVEYIYKAIISSHEPGVGSRRITMEDTSLKRAVERIERYYDAEVISIKRGEPVED